MGKQCRNSCDRGKPGQSGNPKGKPKKRAGPAEADGAELAQLRAVRAEAAAALAVSAALVDCLVGIPSAAARSVFPEGLPQRVKERAIVVRPDLAECLRRWG